MGHHIGEMGSDREGAGAGRATLRDLPVALVPLAADAGAVLAGARRAGAHPTPVVLIDPGEDDVARAVREEDAEFVVVRCGDIDASIETALALTEAGGRVVAALGLRGSEDAPGLDVATIALLTDDRLRDLNVPVPALEGAPRSALWNSLRTVRVEERHHLVEVDGRPAFDWPGGAGVVPTPSVLAVGAVGVLVGRMAAANRRWRDDT